MVTDADYGELRGRGDLVWIDVRSEGEFSESTIPGAVNIPLFRDGERARIGVAYKQESPERARELGLEIASGHLPELVGSVARTLDGRTAAVFCWRGGMRSRTVAAVLDLMGVPAVRVRGGYRAYRQYVGDRLSAFTPEQIPAPIVVHGMTGVGKTLLLNRLAALGEPVLDLEAIAGHRGSVFGGIGLSPHNQRQFDSLLLDELERLSESPFLFMEAESRRIGNASMPDFLFEAKRRGRAIELTASLDERVRRTLAQYQTRGEPMQQAARRAIGRIEKRFGPDLRSRVNTWLEAEEWPSLVRALLEEYYDPRYRHAMGQYDGSFLRIDGEDLDAAAEAVRRFARDPIPAT